jgi:hypothetical protein
MPIQVVIPQVRRHTIRRRSLSLSSNTRGRTEKKNNDSKRGKSKTSKNNKSESNNTRLNRIISEIKGELIYPNTNGTRGVIKKSELFKNIKSEINDLYKNNNLSVRTILAIPQFNELLKIVKYNLRTQPQTSRLNKIFEKIKQQVDDLTKYKILITKLNYLLSFKQKKTFKTRYKKGGTSNSSKSNSSKSSRKSSSSKTSNRDETCVICLEEIIDSDSIDSDSDGDSSVDKYTLNSNNRDLNSKYIFSNDGCGHSFHKNCIEKWIEKTSFSCPICRHEYKRISGYDDVDYVDDEDDENDQPSQFSENAGVIVVTLVLCCTVGLPATLIGGKLALLLLPLL